MYVYDFQMVLNFFRPENAGNVRKYIAYENFCGSSIGHDHLMQEKSSKTTNGKGLRKDQKFKKIFKKIYKM